MNSSDYKRYELVGVNCVFHQAEQFAQSERDSIKRVSIPKWSSLTSFTIRSFSSTQETYLLFV